MQLRTRYWILTVVTAAGLTAADSAEPAKVMMEAARKKEVVDGDLSAAIKQYGAIAARYAKSDRAVSAMALVRMAECYQKMGDAESQKIYERVLREYGDQKEAAALARARLGGHITSATRTQAARQLWITRAGEDAIGHKPSPDGRYICFTDWNTGDLGLTT